MQLLGDGDEVAQLTQFHLATNYLSARIIVRIFLLTDVSIAQARWRPWTKRTVRIELDGAPVTGRREGGLIITDDGREVVEAQANYLAPVTPSKVLAVHLTYRSRIDEYAARVPPEPSYFSKPPTTLNGHRREVRRPHGTRFLNYEGELAVVIGRRMKGVAIEDALHYVAGYAPANDVGLHDFRHADRGSMLRVKGQDGFLPLGPELVPASEFDPTDFTLRTYPQRRGRAGGRRR